MDDTRQGGIACNCRYPVVEGTGFVDSSRKHGVAFGFVHRQAFPGDRRLVHRRTASDDQPVQPDTLARFHPHHAAHRDGFGFHYLPGAIGQLHGNLFRRQLQEPLDGFARPVQ